MNNENPFDKAFERKMKELLSSNEDEAWRKMQLLLDEKKKRRFIIFFRNYKGWLVAAILLLTSLWVISFYEKHNPGKSLTHIHDSSKQTIANSQKQLQSNKVDTKNIIDSDILKNTIVSVDKQKKSSSISAETQHQQVKDNQPVKPLTSLSGSIDEKALSNENSKNKTNLQKSIQKVPLSKKPIIKNDTILNKSLGITTDATAISKTKANNPSIIKPSANTLQNNLPGSVTALKDSISGKSFASENMSSSSKLLSNKQNKDSSALVKNNMNTSIKDSNKTSVKDSGLLTNKKKDASLKKKGYLIGMGIQLKQQIPLSGGNLSSYNYNGNKDIFSDYIPGIFIRVERNNKWFLQGEYNYAAPDLIKPFSFSRQTKVNYTTSTVLINSNTLQKTYFNELPLCFNYYLHSKWFVGAGLEYTWFRGAVTNQQVIYNNLLSGEQTMQEQIIPIKNYSDSFLYRSNERILFQAGYATSKWLFNLRCTNDIQPFITYTEPDGTIINKKNTSLEFVVNYKLFSISTNSKKQKSSK